MWWGSGVIQVVNSLDLNTKCFSLFKPDYCRDCLPFCAYSASSKDGKLWTVFIFGIFPQLAFGLQHSMALRFSLYRLPFDRLALIMVRPGPPNIEYAWMCSSSTHVVPSEWDSTFFRALKPIYLFAWEHAVIYVVQKLASESLFFHSLLSGFTDTRIPHPYATSAIPMKKLWKPQVHFHRDFIGFPYENRMNLWKFAKFHT